MRGGGHNIAGLAVCEGGLMIDLSLMKGVWVDPRAKTARAQAGCTLGDVDRETQHHSPSLRPQRYTLRASASRPPAGPAARESSSCGGSSSGAVRSS